METDKMERLQWLLTACCDIPVERHSDLEWLKRNMFVYDTSPVAIEAHKIVVGILRVEAMYQPVVSAVPHPNIHNSFRRI